MAQHFLEQGVMPSGFYDSSFGDMQDALNAKPRDDRVQDPMEWLKKIGLR